MALSIILHLVQVIEDCQVGSSGPPEHSLGDPPNQWRSWTSLQNFLKEVYGWMSFTEIEHQKGISVREGILSTETDFVVLMGIPGIFFFLKDTILYTELWISEEIHGLKIHIWGLVNVVGVGELAMNTRRESIPEKTPKNRHLNSQCQRRVQLVST